MPLVKQAVVLKTGLFDQCVSTAHLVINSHWRVRYVPLDGAGAEDAEIPVRVQFGLSSKVVYGGLDVCLSGGARSHGLA